MVEEDQLMQSLRAAKASDAGMPFPQMTGRGDGGQVQPADTLPPRYDSGMPGGGGGDAGSTSTTSSGNDPQSPAGGLASFNNAWWDSESGSLVLQRTDGSQVYIPFSACP